MPEYKPSRIDVCIHESPLIRGTICNGCLCLEVLLDRRRSIEREKYYCKFARGYFNPRKVDECEHLIKTGDSKVLK